MPPARRQLDRLPISVVAAVIETLSAIADNPRRLGKPLRFELVGHWSARRGSYRIIYSIDDEARTGPEASYLLASAVLNLIPALAGLTGILGVALVEAGKLPTTAMAAFSLWWVRRPGPGSGVCISPRSLLHGWSGTPETGGPGLEPG